MCGCDCFEMLTQRGWIRVRLVRLSEPLLGLPLPVLLLVDDLDLDFCVRHGWLAGWIVGGSGSLVVGASHDTNAAGWRTKVLTGKA